MPLICVHTSHPDCTAILIHKFQTGGRPCKLFLRTQTLSMYLKMQLTGVEKVSDHGTIGPRKYFGSQKETDHTKECAM